MMRRGGVLLDTGQELRFLPAHMAATIVPLETIVPVPGMAKPAVGLVLTEDRVATVLQVGTLHADSMVLCEVDGGSIALTGARVLATGMFDGQPDGESVSWYGQEVSILDVRGLTLEVETAIWRARVAARDERDE